MAPIPEFKKRSYYLARFLPKTTWKWKKLDRGRASLTPLWIRQWTIRQSVCVCVFYPDRINCPDKLNPAGLKKRSIKFWFILQYNRIYPEVDPGFFIQGGGFTCCKLLRKTAWNREKFGLDGGGGCRRFLLHPSLPPSSCDCKKGRSDDTSWSRTHVGVPCIQESFCRSESWTKHVILNLT